MLQTKTFLERDKEEELLWFYSIAQWQKLQIRVGEMILGGWVSSLTHTQL